MKTVTLTIRIDILQETLIALRTRQIELSKAMNNQHCDTVYDILNRQYSRTSFAIEELEFALGERK